MSFYAEKGTWRWDRFRDLLPVTICAKIAALKPPTMGMDHYPYWPLESNGIFSLRSAYLLLATNNQVDNYNKSLFKMIWKWSGPNRIRTFLWKLAHGRLLTNEERTKRGMSFDALCPRCNEQQESIMHVFA